MFTHFEFCLALNEVFYIQKSIKDYSKILSRLSVSSSTSGVGLGALQGGPKFLGRIEQKIKLAGVWV